MNGVEIISTRIVILSCNQLNQTRNCIQTIREYTEIGTYQIGVVDNGSTDGTREWLKMQEDIESIFIDDIGYIAGYNQGLKAATEEHVLLISNDVLVTANWLSNLLNALHSQLEVGAVGPISNLYPYDQVFEAKYQTLDQMQAYARSNNTPDSGKWERRVKLPGFCLLMKKEVLDKSGYLDESYTSGYYGDDDLSFRILNSGYQLLLCNDVFVHHNGDGTLRDNRVEFQTTMEKNRILFKEKWGFESNYSSFIRKDVLELMDGHQSDQPIRVLEIGCACGATLLEIKNRYKKAELYGIELDENSAAIASFHANVSASNVEHSLAFENNFFDYIILPDVLEHLQDPWTVLINLKSHLKNDGKILASIPNVMHYSVIRDLINGRWEYTDSGLLDRTHLRFFTLIEIDSMFRNTGYKSLSFTSKKIHTQSGDEDWINKLVSLNPSNEVQYRTYQYLVKAVKNEYENPVSKLISGLDSDFERKCLELCDLLIQNESLLDEVVSSIASQASRPEDALNLLAMQLYQQKQYNVIIPLLSKSYEINSKHQDTLYNLGYILSVAGEKDLALHYLDQIQNKDQEVVELIAQLSRSEK